MKIICEYILPIISLIAACVSLYYAQEAVKYNSNKNNKE